ncbi:unnamed protein product [Rotaria sp. Silwood1]|nr:unnamed protein product [Rotaria sp. Silwood1]CAF5132801.1 unnamed protein product [Rotaria sp. Silwood1]
MKFEKGLFDNEFILYLDAVIIASQYAASQRAAIQRFQQHINISIEPKTLAAIVILLDFQITVANEQFPLHDNNDYHQR